jgi:hypothetical protein
VKRCLCIFNYYSFLEFVLEFRMQLRSGKIYQKQETVPKTIRHGVLYVWSEEEKVEFVRSLIPPIILLPDNENEYEYMDERDNTTVAYSYDDEDYSDMEEYYSEEYEKKRKKFTEMLNEVRQIMIPN